jgi:serine/threonine-protein kinase
MSTTITLTVTRGPLAGQQYAFTAPATCVIGRSSDCSIRLPQDVEHLDVSRHHCALDVTPPAVRVRDLGSLNGTFVNGSKIGQRDRFETPRPVDLFGPPAVELSDGDELRLGGCTAFQVCISPPGPSPERSAESSWHARTEMLDGPPRTARAAPPGGG